MNPWEIVENLHIVEDPSEILSKLDPADPFWVGASYAIDPFVGMIYRLPIRKDPTNYGHGLPTRLFDEAAEAIINGNITGDNLGRAIEALSRTCTQDEWLFWYKPILKGDMIIPLSLDAFNKFCPEKHAVRAVRLHKPKPITSLSDLPSRFFIQPEYRDERVFWMIDSRYQPIEIRCYDSQIRRVQNNEIQASLAEMASKQQANIVLFGHMSKRGLLVDDVLTRDQFAKESGAPLLHKRLMGAAMLRLETVQMSPLITPQNIDRFYKELDLVLQQGFEGAVIRDLEGHFPQPDVLVKPSVKFTATCTTVIPGVGIKAEAVRGKKVIEANIRLGLTETVWKDISESSIGRRLDGLSCGQKEGELLLPVFQQWRN